MTLDPDEHGHIDRSHPLLRRFVDAPGPWSKNPDCDMHGPYLVDLMMWSDPSGDDHAINVTHDVDSEVWPPRFHVSLDLGLGYFTRDEAPSIHVSAGRVQTAVDILAHHCMRQYKA